MNKRSALLVSAGLVLTLIVGGLAVATGLTGPTVSNAVPRADRRSSPEPIVRTVRRTVTVHKKGDAKPGEVVQIAAPAATPATSSVSSDSTVGDDAYEHEGDEQDEHEDIEHAEDHEDEGNDD